MKQVSKEVKTYKTVFVADDGTEFESSDECKKYELSAKNTIKGMFSETFDVRPDADYEKKLRVVEGLPLWLAYGPENYLFTVKPKTLDELEVLNKYLHLYGNSCYGADAVGKIIILEYTAYDHEVYTCGTVDDWKLNFEKTIALLVGEDTDENM